MADLTSKDVVLLACPFCGGSVEVGHYHPDLGPSSCFVKCWCGARGTEHQYQHGDHKEAIAKAAASWNRRIVETSGKQPDWDAEYKKLAGVYSRTGLEDFIAKHWPGNKLVNVSAEEPRETIGLICYNPCEKHKGMSFTMTIGTPAVLVRTVCPHCEPIRPEEPVEPQNDKCQHDLQVAGNSIVLTDNNTRAVCVYCAQEWHNPALPVKASDELRALYNATVDDLNKEQEV